MTGDNEGKSERLHMFISPTEVESIETWRYENRVQSKSEAVRRLCQIGLSYERDGKVLLKRTERALKATLMTFEKIDKAAAETMPKGIRGGLAVVLQEQVAAYEAAVAALTEATVFRNSLDRSDIDDMIRRAKEQVDLLASRKAAK